MVNIMQSVNATEVRKNWSITCDNARVRPSFIRRTHDNLFLSSTENMINLLSTVRYDCIVFKEADGSYTVSAVSMDLVENAKTKETAIDALSDAILDYAEEYYDQYELYAKSPNRKGHLPFITKALLLGSSAKIKEAMVCRNGRT